MRLGCDPEVFLIDQNNKHISVVGLVEGNKRDPWQIPELPQGFTLQQDNVALEFGIPPANTVEAWVNFIEDVQQAGLKKIKNLTYSTKACVEFDKDQLQTAAANIFGCEPDFNAWTGKENPPIHCDVKNLRSAGGHIHVETDLDKQSVVRAMDLFLGLPSLFLDLDTERKKLYGKAGAYRPKDYGVEYRVLSNYWIFDKKLIKWVWYQTKKALEFEMYSNCGFTPVDVKLIQQAINTNNKELAAGLMESFGVTM